jgi:hypothetical protein
MKKKIITILSTLALLIGLALFAGAGTASAHPGHGDAVNHSYSTGNGLWVSGSAGDKLVPVGSTYAGVAHRSDANYLPIGAGWCTRVNWWVGTRLDYAITYHGPTRAYIGNDRVAEATSVWYCG